MTTYFEYGVNLSDNQKRSLASAMNSNTPLTLRLKHGNLTGNDELMLTKTQLKRIQKSLNNGTGADIKISKTQIRKVAKQGGSLFSTLASLGARIDTITNEINRVMKTGGRLVIKLTRKQIEGGFLGALASIGIPIATELVSKMFGKGLQVDKTLPPPPPNPLSNVYLPQSGGKFPMYPPPVYGNWGETIGMGKKTGKGNKTGKGKKKGQGLLLGKNSPFNPIPILGAIL